MRLREDGRFRLPRVIALVFASAVAAVGIAFGLRALVDGSAPPMLPAPFIFYAVVLDEADAPVVGTRVAARTVVMHESVTVGMGSGGRVRWAESVPQTVVSGPAGVVTIALPPGHAVLWIEAVEAPGFDQVLELVPHTLRPGAATRCFEYSGPSDSAHVYKSDPDRPAILRLHRRGSPMPVGTISRGGFDLPRNKPPIANEAVVPHIPSAGPDAPVDQEDATRRANAWAQDPRNWPKH